MSKAHDDTRRAIEVYIPVRVRMALNGDGTCEALWAEPDSEGSPFPRVCGDVWEPELDEWRDGEPVERDTADGFALAALEAAAAIGGRRELATILAALRYWQREGWASSGAEIDISTDGGTLEPLSRAEIDALCERLNLGGDA